MRGLSDIMAELLEGSEHDLSQVPRTPQERAEARKRLELARMAVKNCQVCLDTGFVHPLKDNGKVDYSLTVPCVCVRQEAERKQKERLLKYCELPAKAEGMTFASFRRSKETEEAYRASLALAKGDYEPTFLTLTGPTNHGKTHLLVSVCNYRLQQGKLAKYAYVPYLLDELRAGFKKNGDESYFSRYNVFLNVPLLALDDLGTENDTPWAQEHLDELVDYRVMHKLQTIVTTNLPWKSLPFRVASRLKREGEVIIIGGPEYEAVKSK
jgi:DNA replication protein DnaC